MPSANPKQEAADMPAVKEPKEKGARPGTNKMKSAAKRTRIGSRPR